MREDINCISWWLPKLEQAGLPTPRTILVEAADDLLSLLDGKLPDNWDEFAMQLAGAAAQIGYPCFLRTGHGSAKHDWKQTCYVAAPQQLENHVAALVEWSALADIMGLPTHIWAVRELIETTPLFTAFRGEMPITREFRFFVHWQPYWPSAAIEQPDADDWETRLAAASVLTPTEHAGLVELAELAVAALGGGYWSVDLLQDRNGEFWLTDMADGDRSFKWSPDDA